MKLYHDVFGISFEILPLDRVHRKKNRDARSLEKFEEQPHITAFSNTALIMVQAKAPVVPTFPKPGLAEFSFKVNNLEQAKSEMKSAGIRQVSSIVIGNCREAVFNAEDLGVYMSLLEYDTPTEWEALFTDNKGTQVPVEPIKPDTSKGFKIEGVSSLSIAWTT